MKHSTKSGKARAALSKPQPNNPAKIAPTPEPRKAALQWAADEGGEISGLSPAFNLMSERGTVADSPTTTYLLLAQRFEDGKDLEWIQDIELTLNEYDKLRRYLAELRGLIPAKDAA